MRSVMVCEVSTVCRIGSDVFLPKPWAPFFLLVRSFFGLEDCDDDNGNARTLQLLGNIRHKVLEKNKAVVVVDTILFLMVLTY